MSEEDESSEVETHFAEIPPDSAYADEVIIRRTARICSGGLSAKCWELVGAVGIEPTTFGLKGRCSTTELRPYGVNPQL